MLPAVMNAGLRPGLADDASRDRVASGHTALDELLGGGWPLGMLTELLVPAPGSAELGLLCPALARLASSGRILLVAPPLIPYAQGLVEQGLALDRVLIVRVRRPVEMLWAMEEALRSGACAGVVAWAGTAAIERMGPFLLQRLHLLASRKNAWAVLIRAARFRGERSPARLRLQLQCAPPATLQVEIFKNQGRRTGTVAIERRFHHPA